MSITNPIRPKVKAGAQGAGGATAGAVILAFLLRLLGVDVEGVPPEVLLLVAGAAATTVGTYAAYVKKDGLRGAWQRLVNGERPPAG